MKKLFILLLMVGCVGVIFVGNLHWKSLNASLAPAEAESSEQSEEANQADTTSTEGNIEGYLAYTAKWSSELRSTFENRLAEGEALNMVIVGSQAMDAVEPGWNDKVAEAVNAAYGETISVRSVSYDSTSFDFVEEGKGEEIADMNPHLVVFEPLLLNDNGVVRIEDSLDYVEDILEDIASSNAGVEFIFTPSQPLYSPGLYATQIQALQEFADENDYIYINHWENWPDVQSEEVKDYLNDDSSPNALGQEAWANAIISYLITE